MRTEYIEAILQDGARHGATLTIAFDPTRQTFQAEVFDQFSRDLAGATQHSALEDALAELNEQCEAWLLEQETP